MKTVTWAPDGANEQLLTAVQVPPGKITEAQWIEALADRVQAMVSAAEDPQAALHQAVRALTAAGAATLPEGQARYAGQTLVTHNLDLITEMSRMNPEFPQIATNNVSEPELMDDLDNWIELASMALHP